MTYYSKTLPRWTHPDSYAGHDPLGDYQLCGRSRDSDALEESNYRRIFDDLKKKAVELGQPENTATDYEEDNDKQWVYDFRAGHWAVGWVEQVILRKTAPEKLIQFAEEIKEKLEGYPVYDDEDFSNLEMEQSNEFWSHSSVKERYEWLKEYAPEVSIFAARHAWVPSNDGRLDEMLRE